MTELQLYNFVLDKEINITSETEVYIIIDFCDLQELANMLSSTYFDTGVEAITKDTYCVISLTDICDYYTINIKNIVAGSLTGQYCNPIDYDNCEFLSSKLQEHKHDLEEVTKDIRNVLTG